MNPELEEKPKVNYFTGKRLPSLTFLCILTFIGSGVSALSSVFVVLAYDIMPMAVEQSPIPGSKEMMELVIAAGRSFFVYMGLLYSLSLLGAIFMWKLNKKGFHLYTLAQLLLLIVPLLMLTGYKTPFSTIILTASFILSYGVNLRFMR